MERNRGRPFRRHTCRSCRYQQRKARGGVQPSEYFRDRRRLKEYGVTPEDVAAMRDAQGGMCAGCGREFNGGRGHEAECVDHDHTTGRVRGLLCGACNLALGYVKDDPARLRALADYLEKA